MRGELLLRKVKALCGGPRGRPYRWDREGTQVQRAHRRLVRLLRLITLSACLLTIPTLIALDGCGRSDVRSIESLLERREDAIEARDADLYLTCISPAYNDAGRDIEALQTQIRNTFRIFHSVEIEAMDLSISIKGDEARVNQTIHLIASVKSAGSAELERRERRYEESLRLRKEAGEWRITGGL